MGKDGLRVWDWHVYTVVYGMIGQQGLLYRTGNSTQCSVIICMEKESEKEKKKKKKKETRTQKCELICLRAN